MGNREKGSKQKQDIEKETIRCQLELHLKWTVIPPTVNMLYALKMPHRGWSQKETTSFGRKIQERTRENEKQT